MSGNISKIAKSHAQEGVENNVFLHIFKKTTGNISKITKTQYRQIINIIKKNDRKYKQTCQKKGVEHIVFFI